MPVTPFPIVTLVRLLHQRKSPVPMVVTLLGIVRLVRPELEKAANPMFVTLLGIVTFIRLVQAVNALSRMSVTLLGIITLVRLGQSKNVSSPMLVTLVGIVTWSGSSKQRTPCYRCW